MKVMPHKKILLVDDDADTLALLKKRLEAHGFECVLCRSVEAAMEALRLHNPDLVLLDLMFHGADGTAFLAWARSQEKSPPIIVISGMHEKEVIDYVMDMGAASFIKKPIDSHKLVRVIHDSLETSSAGSAI